MTYFRFALIAFFITASPAHANVLGEHGDWVATQLSEAKKPLCYMSAAPQTSKGKYKKRGDVYAIITHRPAEKSFGVVSFQAGYTLKKDAPVTVTIDTKKTFKLFSQGEFAWTTEASDDKALVKAMRSGGKMVVKGTSSRGTLTTDSYSLSGFSAALKSINKACGVQ